MLNNPNRPCGGFLFYKLPTTSRHKLPIALRQSQPANVLSERHERWAYLITEMKMWRKWGRIARKSHKKTSFFITALVTKMKKKMDKIVQYLIKSTPCFSHEGKSWEAIFSSLIHQGTKPPLQSKDPALLQRDWNQAIHRSKSANTSKDLALF